MSDALHAEGRLRSEFRIYEPDGSWMDADAHRADDDLAALYAYERKGSRAARAPSAHVALMRELELADYEPASDPGNLRWYPRGTIVKRLLERGASDVAAAFGALEVETPVMYDLAHPQLGSYLHRFPARQYVVHSDECEHFLRFAACFGQYMILHDATLSYRHLPVRLHEVARYAFRRERSGELAGLRRLRAFTMPDMHTVVRDAPMAAEEFIAQARLCVEWLRDVEVSCVPVVRFVRQFVERHPELLRELLALLDRRVLVELWDERAFYFVAKFELNVVDGQRKAACLGTVQIDVENGERFGIGFVDRDATERPALLLHTSISGAIERNVYAILEAQAQRIAAGGKGRWPAWLAPVQVRIVPVADRHVEPAVELARRIDARVDVDDRQESLSKRVRDAERTWVSRVVVFGDREARTGRLAVRTRHGADETMTVEQLARWVRDDDLRGLQTATRLSRQPTFVGS